MRVTSGNRLSIEEVEVIDGLTLLPEFPELQMTLLVPLNGIVAGVGRGCQVNGAVVKLLGEGVKVVHGL